MICVMMMVMMMLTGRPASMTGIILTSVCPPIVAMVSMVAMVAMVVMMSNFDRYLLCSKSQA